MVMQDQVTHKLLRILVQAEAEQDQAAQLEVLETRVGAVTAD
jgi:hypothetical protein